MILVPCLIYSQDFVNIQNLKTLSDKEVLSYWADAKSNGYTIDQIKTIASSQGFSASDILEFEERLNELLELDSADLMVGSDESISSVITQTDNELSEETGLTLFGKEFFLKSSLDTSPQINIATPQSYQLGPGDEITISIWGAAEAGYKLGVNKEGYVKIPRIAPVFISGLTVKEATLKLERSLSKIYSGLTSNTNSLNKTFYSLSLSKTRSVVINILGEVVSPGLYTVSSMSSVLNALYFAGGPNEIGTYRSIDIIRNGKKFTTVDLYDYFLNGVSQNIFLRDQDVILVKAYKKRASSTGEFKRNNIFELTENETISDLIKYSGEFNSLAFKNEVYIERINGINKKIITLSEEAFQNEKIYDGDILTAKAVSSEVMNKVSIEGAVVVTGDFQLEKAKTVKGLFELSQGFEKDAVTNLARLFREKNGAVRELISIEIEKIINGAEKDIELEPNDRIVVSSINDLEALGSVRIIGEVNEPGEYAFYDGINVENLVVSAKGFSPLSNNNEIVIYRLTYDETGKKPIRTLSSRVDVNFESNGLDSKIKLEKNDLVVVRKISGYSEIETATIQGLIKNQGNYALKDTSYSLYDILMDSGGFLEDASIEGLSIKRDSTIFSVDVPKLLESRGTSVKNNIVLKKGDIITVPKIDNTVFIDGEVGSPKYISYQSGLSLKNAINQSGGFTPLSDRKGSYVQYQNGNIKATKKFLFFNFYPKVKAGSKIFVPTKPEKSTAGGILNSVVGELLTVVTTLGTLGALLKTVN
jgi:protein involved in polysaccharide export with SLBB domain